MSPRPWAVRCASTGSRVSTLEKRAPRSSGRAIQVSAQYSAPRGGSSIPRLARWRGTTVSETTSLATRECAEVLSELPSCLQWPVLAVREEGGPRLPERQALADQVELHPPVLA